MSKDDVQAIIELIKEVDDASSLREIRQFLDTHPVLLAERGSTQAASQAIAAGLFGSTTPPFRVGDAVEFNGSVSPKYLAYRKGMVVVKVNDKSVVVDCPDDPGFARFKGKKNVRCPKSLIQHSTS
jgi:hypothetical protein